MIKKILVSQPKPSSEKSPYYDIARKYNVDIVFHPFIKVEGVSAKEFRAQHINLQEFTAVVFNSRHAVDNFFHLAKELRVNISDEMKYFCVTEQVALYIQKYVQYRKRKVFFGSTGKIEDVLPFMLKHKTERYFVPVSDVHNNAISTLLDSKKLQHVEGIMYRTVSNDFSSDEIFDYDLVVFFSPSGVHSLLKNFPDFKTKMSQKTAIGTFGANTANTAKEQGLTVVLEAPSEKYPSITAALNDYVKHANAVDK